MASFALTAVLVLSTALSSAQDSIQYQLVIRDAAGQLITSKQVNMKFSLISGGQSYYEETQKTTTDKYGNISVFVGTGTAVKGAMKDVPWSTMDIIMKVEADTDGGNSFKELGTVPMPTAPYAMYAAMVGGNGNNGSSKDDEALFEVCDRDGQPVFAVYNDGIVVYIDEVGDTKNKRSGFKVTGRNTKDGESADYFSVDAEGTHVYVDDDDTKVKRSGFVVTGRSTKGASGSYTAERTADKSTGTNIFAVSGGLTTVYVDDDDSKNKRSGFVVTGRSAKSGNFVDVSAKNANLLTKLLNIAGRADGNEEPQPGEEPAQPQSLFTISGGQVMLHTDIVIEDEVIEVGPAPMRGEYALTVIDSMWFIPAVADDYTFSSEYNQLMAIYDEGEYAPAMSVKSLTDNLMETQFLFFNGEGYPTSNVKKAAVVVFKFGEGLYVIRPLEPIANKTIEFGLMNSNNEFVKISANISSENGLPIAEPYIGEFEGGKIINEGGGGFGSIIMLKAVPDEGKIFGGWTQTTIDEQGETREDYVYGCFINGVPLVDESMFSGVGMRPIFTEPVLYVGNTESYTNTGFTADKPIYSVERTLYYMAQLAKVQSTLDKIDWTIKVVGDFKGSQAIPETTIIPVNNPEDPQNVTTETIYVKDIVNSIRLTGNDENAKLNGDGNNMPGNSVLSVNVPVPVTIDNLTITGGYAYYGGGGINVGAGACVIIADGAKITGNRADNNESGASGGGVYVATDYNTGKYGTLIMTGGQITGNIATIDGGGIFGHQNSLIVIGGSAVIGNTEITGEVSSENCANSAKNGGAISTMGNLYIGYKLKDDVTEITAANLVEDENSTVTIQGNYGSENGGGISVSGGDAELYVSNATMAYNATATSGKGNGVYIGSGTFTVSGAPMLNTANDVYLDNGNKITIGEKLGGTGTVATISLENYIGGTLVLDGDAELVAKEYSRFEVAAANTGVSPEGKLVTIIGTKSGPNALGDIVFTDGSAIAYSDELTQGQKNSAVAVIFDAENKKGVALGQSSDKMQWCTDISLIGYEDIYKACFVDVSDSCLLNDGKALTEAIYHIGDFEMNSGNYPPFEYAKGYMAGGYTDWYIPALDELGSINYNSETLNQAINKAGGTAIQVEVLEIPNCENCFNYPYYWSSTQDMAGRKDNYYPNATYAYSVRFDYPNNFKQTPKIGDSQWNEVAYSRCVRQFGANDNNSKLTTFYVASDADNGGIGSDSNDGLSGNTPFATIEQASSMMTEAKNYLVVICGEVKGSQTIQNTIPAGATITIKGIIGNTTDTLNANNSGASLTINTSVPVLIDNLRILGGSNSGIRILNNNADVTLGSGVIVGDDDSHRYNTNIANKSGDNGKGGGVYIDGGTLTMLSGSKVLRNTATQSGGGIYLDNGATLVMNDCEVSRNSASTSGGGIYIAEGATFVMNDGEMQYNNASDFGQTVYDGGTFNMNGGEIGPNANGGKSSVYVDKNAQFNISGKAEIYSDDVVFLDSDNDKYATINITGTLEGENRVAVIKPSVFTDNIPLLTTSVVDYLPTEKFAIAVSEGNFGDITSEGTLKIDFTKGRGTMKSLNGEFSVSSSKKVQFSSGNLLYHTAQPKRWEFAAHQYDELDYDNITYSVYGASFNSPIDLFCYGTSGYNGIEPTRNIASNDVYYSGNLTEDGEDYDWGVRITKDYKTTEQWRTLTQTEWNYLLKRRTNASQLYGLGRVNNIIGLILLPDDWSSDGMPAFTSGNLDYDINNQFDSDQWTLMEENGAVFLPATGYRYGSNMDMYVDKSYQGYYWSATKGGILFFDGRSGSSQSSDRKCETRSGTVYYGYAVRLVHDN